MIQLKKEKGFTELIVLSNCEFEDFYQFAEKFKKELSIDYDEKVHDFDALYWVFKYEGVSLIISYDSFSGISIYPKNGKEASVEDNEKIIKIMDIITNRQIG